MFAKVCGITRLEDALHAVSSGATALGFVFWPKSPRFVTADHVRTIVAGLPADVMTVGVFVNERLDVLRRTLAASGVSAVQLHGDEPASYGESLAWPVFKSVSRAGASQAQAWPSGTTLLIDAYDPVRRGGTGVTADWAYAADLARRYRVILAGGLTAANVAEAIDRVRPFGVDVSSGVEASPGIKDPRTVTEFLSAARAAFARSVGLHADRR